MNFLISQFFAKKKIIIETNDNKSAVSKTSNIINTTLILEIPLFVVIFTARFFKSIYFPKHP